MTGSEDLSRWRDLVETAVRAELDRLVVLCGDDHALRAELTGVSVVVLDDAPEEEPDLLGLYLGVPVTEAGDRFGHLPPLVQLFLLPLVDMATAEHLDHLEPDTGRLVEETVITVRHELAHHFGMDHDRLGQLGLA
jgi:predicted Zn-dependent protease with MMP-like domain